METGVSLLVLSGFLALVERAWGPSSDIPSNVLITSVGVIGLGVGFTISSNHVMKVTIKKYNLNF